MFVNGICAREGLLERWPMRVEALNPVGHICRASTGASWRPIIVTWRPTKRGHIGMPEHHLRCGFLQWP